VRLPPVTLEHIVSIVLQQPSSGLDGNGRARGAVPSAGGVGPADVAAQALRRRAQDVRDREYREMRRRGRSP
jgi:hypothetical protein